MSFVSLKAWRARSAERAVLSTHLKTTLTAALDLTVADALSINEIACTDPGCPDVETIVLVMRAGEPTRALKIQHALDAIDAGDVSKVVDEEARARSRDRGAHP